MVWMINVIKKYISQRCAGVTLCIMEHTVEASEARWIADPFIDQLRFGLAHEDVGMVVFPA